MGKLLSTLEQPIKKPYQLYTIEHGIERLQVAVPLSSANQFEAAFSALEVKAKPNILKLVEEVKGKVKSNG